MIPLQIFHQRTGLPDADAALDGLSGIWGHSVARAQSVAPKILAWAQFAGENAVVFLSQPRVLAVTVGWAATYTTVYTLISMLGFGPIGIIKGSIAATWQSYMYGAFTPAGGIFATVTSVGMTTWVNPLAGVGAGVVATCVAAAIAASGVGS